MCEEASFNVFGLNLFLLILQTHTGMKSNTAPKKLAYTEHYRQLLGGCVTVTINKDTINKTTTITVT